MKLVFLVLLSTFSFTAYAEIKAEKTSIGLEKITPFDAKWNDANLFSLDLTAQPMIAPRPSQTTTEKLAIQALYNESTIAFKLVWKDTEKSEAGRLAKQSDAIAIQFPVRASGEVPPLVFMGAKGDPVHIFHWRAQYSRDAETGKPTMKELYPNMSVDMYPMEFKDHGKIAKISDAEREKYAPAVAVGNPQSYPKDGVDEIIAEGFGTSAVKKPSRIKSTSRAVWKDGSWNVVISRPLATEDGSDIQPKNGSQAAFAVWQGGLAEVGSRKSVSMMWTPILFSEFEGGGKK